MVMFGDDFVKERLLSLKSIIVNEKITISEYNEKRRENQKVVILFKVPPPVEGRAIVDYDSSYGTVVGRIRRQMYKQQRLEQIQSGNITVMTSRKNYQLGCMHWIGGSKAYAYFHGIGKVCFWRRKTREYCDHKGFGKTLPCRRIQENECLRIHA